MSESEEIKALSPHKILSSSTNPLAKNVTPTLDEIKKINVFNFHRHLSNHPVYCRLAERFSRYPLLTPIEVQYQLLKIISKQFGPVRYIIGKKKVKDAESDIIDGIVSYYQVNRQYAKEILNRYKKDEIEYAKLLRKLKNEGKL